MHFYWKYLLSLIDHWTFLFDISLKYGFEQSFKW